MNRRPKQCAGRWQFVSCLSGTNAHINKINKSLRKVHCSVPVLMNFSLKLIKSLMKEKKRRTTIQYKFRTLEDYGYSRSQPKTAFAMSSIPLTSLSLPLDADLHALIPYRRHCTTNTSAQSNSKKAVSVSVWKKLFQR